ncbi:MAG: DUF6364 family protein [Deferrisomatales bacterium]|nr:DUF6364 family protein [Deferrisomatales bacterium]
MAVRQNLTVSLDLETIRKAKALAAARHTSVTRLIGGLVEQLVEDADRYDRAKASALAYLEQGFPLGGRITASRDDLHER